MSLFPATKLVVPVDFSELSTRALETAAPMVAEIGGLYAVHALPPIPYGEPGVMTGLITEHTRVENARRALETILDEVGAKGAHAVILSESSGNAAYAIAQYADQIDAEVIVLPSHGRTGLARIAIGSVAERVVRFAKCPVLVLREPKG